MTEKRLINKNNTTGWLNKKIGQVFDPNEFAHRLWLAGPALTDPDVWLVVHVLRTDVSVGLGLLDSVPLAHWDGGCKPQGTFGALGKGNASVKERTI